MPNPQEAAATRAKALLLDLPWIFGIEKADQKPLEQAITAALTEARSAGLKEAADFANGFWFPDVESLAAALDRMAGAAEQKEAGDD